MGNASRLFQNDLGVESDDVLKGRYGECTADKLWQLNETQWKFIEVYFTVKSSV